MLLYCLSQTIDLRIESICFYPCLIYKVLKLSLDVFESQAASTSGVTWIVQRTSLNRG